MNLVLLEEADFEEAAASLASLADGAPRHVVLTGRRLLHLRTVHRAEQGRELRVGLIDGRVGSGVVETIDAERARLRVTLTEPPPAKLDFTLLLSLPRPKTLRRVLQMAATLGIPHLVLMNSWRVEKSYWKSPQLHSAALREQLLLGLEQGGDTVVPQVELQRLLVPFLRDEIEGVARGERLIAHPSATTPCPRHVDGPLTLALGPEGGFLAEEVELFERHGFTPVSLGARLLRVEQAVPALVGRLT
ncbi:MAG: 16S rRNA (uracil(1498)-N(3))-methyltransferase [Planctomycetes bacterium]|nr:16S rRNA (uracil(1498)-N(3))-methyltransferase [Planctomycetota bacterium]